MAPFEAFSPEQRPLDYNLDYNQVYPCPICRHGELSGLTLMEAMGCNFCRHIFTIDLTQQQIQVVDCAQSLKWVWTGKYWQTVGSATTPMTAYIWLLLVGFVLFPSGIVAIGAYMFPTFPDDPLVWLPWGWVALTFLTHLMLFAWGLLEYYQVPAYIGLKLRLQQWLH
jgi:hypothetical protein